MPVLQQSDVKLSWYVCDTSEFNMTVSYASWFCNSIIMFRIVTLALHMLSSHTEWIMLARLEHYTLLIPQAQTVHFYIPALIYLCYTPSCHALTFSVTKKVFIPNPYHKSNVTFPSEKARFYLIPLLGTILFSSALLVCLALKNYLPYYIPNHHIILFTWCSVTSECHTVLYTNAEALHHIPCNWKTFLPSGSTMSHVKMYPLFYLGHNYRVINNKISIQCFRCG